ncbi:MAG TPA: insulinase family protein [Acidiferrobacteraceae bacterium]|nr:insulinase family protein [Acidiferrobacteraceae bacterium]
MFRLFKFGFVFVSGLLVACAPSMPEGPSRVEKVLANGLKVIVQPDHRAPVVVSQIWYKVGGSYEPDGLSGVSHVLEHMMFKGTDTLKPGEFSRIIAAQGGRENAFTSRDYTAYYQRLEKSRLPISFRLEADRMRNLKLTSEEFAKEIKVVMEERRLRTEDKPESLVYERFMHTAFGENTYGQPVIGWMKDLKSMSVGDLQTWYEKWYAPNNATLVVVGDVKPAEVFELADQYFGKYQPSTLPKLVQRPVLQQQTRRVSVSVPAKVPYLIMGFHVPSAALSTGPEWEPYALDVLANVLGDGDSSRLSRKLVRGSQVAVQTGVGYDWAARLQTLLMLDANPTPGHSLDEIEQALLAEIGLLQTELVSPQELTRIKTQLVASDVYERDSVFYQAMKIGQLETVGLDAGLVEAYIKRISAVTAEQVRQVAKKYLVPATMTVARLNPLPIKSKGAVRRLGGRHATRY